MKQNFLCSIIICAVLMGNVCRAQPFVTQINNAVSPIRQFTVDSRFNPIIQHTIPPGATYSSASPDSGKRIIWFEYGDGGFTSDAATNRNINHAVNPPLLVATKLYDTGRDMLRISSGSVFTNNSSSARTSDNQNSLLSGSSFLKITPNAYDIVSRDTMCFALTYKLNTTSTLNKSFYLVFRYSGNVFKQINPGNNTQSSQSIAPENFLLNNYATSALRPYHQETPATIPPANLLQLLPVFPGQSPMVMIEKIVPTALMTGDNNFFLSLVTKDGLAVGNSGAIDAHILQRSGNDSTWELTILPNSSSTLTGMSVAPAHDPNYILQSPVCMALPKTTREMKYHIHFQNTGRGSADVVKVTVNLPMGLNLSTFNLKKAFFSGDEYSVNSNYNQIQVLPDQAGNKIVFRLHKTALNNTLQGTNDVLNPAINPETMGDIYFTVTATVNVPYTLVAQAFIDFHSSSRPLTPHDWEATVPTNIAVSNYSDCCDCNLFECDKETKKGNIEGDK